MMHATTDHPVGLTPSLVDALKRLDGASTRFNEPVAAYTTYKVGGQVAAFVSIESPDGLARTLQLLQEHRAPWLVMGNGSNVLFADQGFGGVVLHLSKGFHDLTLHRGDGPGSDHMLEVGAGLSITRLLRFVKAETLEGLAFLGGIPGTVGGAVRMNAGTTAGELSDALEAAEITCAAEGRRWISSDALGLAYRRSTLPVGSVVTAARLKVRDGDETTRARLDEVVTYRKNTQPLTWPSCGSVFSNPPGDAAGRLIEACGLKGHRIGNAEVSTQHANWILNLGDAKATDIRQLMRECIQQVHAQTGIRLHHEVQLLGDWPRESGEAT
jgi:UDP-N-acetylmuramate dehydrogenase